LRYDENMDYQTSPHEPQMPPLIAEHIEITPGVCGGKPRIAGHRIRVQDVAIWHEQWGYSPEEIVGHYPQLSLADVHAALAYYFDHRDEIQQHIRDADALVDMLKKAIPSKLQQKLAARDSLPDTLSP
jgi:uncharacterized protein (DUF433 family)